jgi:hypothetical protein
MSLIREHRSLIPSTNAEEAASAGGPLFICRNLHGQAWIASGILTSLSGNPTSMQVSGCWMAS